MSDTPTSAGLDVDTALCGRETGDGGVCGKPATVWTYLDDEDWHGYQATACDDHRDELLAHPGVLVSSDAPLTADEDPR